MLVSLAAYINMTMNISAAISACVVTHYFPGHLLRGNVKELPRNYNELQSMVMSYGSRITQELRLITG